MRNYWLWLSVLGALLWANPVAAAELLAWQLDAARQRLVITAAAERELSMPPEVLLRAEAGQLILDLPEAELAAVETAVAKTGAIARVDAQQLSPDFARLAIALRPGHEIAPQAVEWQELAPNQWAVQLPAPDALAQSESPAPAAEPTAEVAATNNPEFQTTRNGFFVRLAEGADSRVAIARSADGRNLELELSGATLPNSLQTAETLAVNRYGVARARFAQLSNEPPRARITLELTGEYPDWEAAFSSRGLAIVPSGAALLDSPPDPVAPPAATAEPEARLAAPERLADRRDNLAEIESVRLGLGNQLLILADRALGRATNRTSRDGVYQIVIPNARLADDFRGPQLLANSPVSQLNVRQQDSTTVVVLVQPANGIEVGSLNQPRRNLLSLQFRRQRVAQPPRPLPPRQPSRRPLPPRRSPSLGPLPRLNNSRALVMLDPGHGGRDPGAIGIGGLREKDVVLPISREVASILQRQGVRVQMTRVDDRYVTLGGRAQIANRARAHVFVSIHANAISMSRPDVNGVETYYYATGRQLAQSIQSSILRSITIGNRGVKRARFYVLRYTSMPSALVEVGFVTGRYDAPRLRNAAFRSQMAEAIARGILEYIQRRRL